MNWPILLMLIMASLADIVTTERALASGMLEGNTLLQNRSVRIAVKIASPVTIYYAARPLPRKYRILMTVAVSSLWGYAAIRNHRQTVRRQK